MREAIGGFVALALALVTVIAVIGTAYAFWSFVFSLLGIV